MKFDDDDDEFSANQYQEKYKVVSDDLNKIKEVNNKLFEDIRRRHNRYIKREQEFRRHIEDLQRELRIRAGYEVNAHEKNEKIISTLNDELQDNIGGISEKVSMLKDEQEQNIVRRFSSIINKMKKSIEEKSMFKGAKAADIKGRENELNHHLELITNIAQRIEKENRFLRTDNDKIQNDLKAQENDRQLLLKQLVLLKKENSKCSEELDFYNKVIEENKEKEEPKNLKNHMNQQARALGRLSVGSKTFNLNKNRKQEESD